MKNDIKQLKGYRKMTKKELQKKIEKQDSVIDQLNEDLDIAWDEMDRYDAYIESAEKALSVLKKTSNFDSELESEIESYVEMYNSELDDVKFSIKDLEKDLDDAWDKLDELFEDKLSELEDALEEQNELSNNLPLRDRYGKFIKRKRN